MRSLAATLVTIVINVAYIVDVLLANDGSAALLIALPYLLSNGAAVVMLVASLFSKPIKTDERWTMLVAAVVASNAYAVLYFLGVPLVNPARIPWLAAIGVLGTLALVPMYAAGVWVLGAQLTVVPEARRLVTRWPYSISRHPLYVTYIAMFALQILIAQSLVIVVLSAVMVVLLYIRARAEEQVLAEAFPEEYREYADRVGWVGRWTPAFARD